MPTEARREFSFLLPGGKRAKVTVVLPVTGALKYDAEIPGGPSLGGYAPRGFTDEQIQGDLIFLYTYR